MKLIIHPGMPKAASSTVQSTLEVGSGTRGAWRILSTSKFGANASVPLGIWVGRKVPEGMRHALSPEDVSKQFEDLAQFRDSDEPVRIISGEGLFKWQAKEFARLVSYLAGPTIEVRIILRDPWSAASSRFQQHIKTHKSDPNVETIRYRSSLEKFDGMRIRAVDFNSLTVDSDRSATFITRSLFPEIDIAEDVGVKNVGLSWPAVRFLFRMNRVLRDSRPQCNQWFRDRKRIVNRLRSLEGPKFRLSHLDTPVDMSELAYVRETFGITWPVPKMASGASHRLEDLMLCYTKKEAQALDHHLGPVLPTLEKTAFRKAVKQTLRGLTKRA